MSLAGSECAKYGRSTVGGILRVSGRGFGLRRIDDSAVRNFAGKWRPSKVATRHWSTIRDDVIDSQPRSPTRLSVSSPHRRQSPVRATRNNYVPPPPSRHRSKPPKSRLSRHRACSSSPAAGAAPAVVVRYIHKL